MAGTPFELSQPDVAAFLQAVPLAADEIESHHKANSGDPELDWSFSGRIPRNGRAYAWGSRWVLVSLDAKWRWRFIDITDMSTVQSLVASSNASEFFSPPGNVYLEIWNGLGSSIASVTETPKNILEAGQKAVTNFIHELQDEAHRAEYILLAVVLGILIVVGVAVVRVKAFDIPGLSIKGGK